MASRKAAAQRLGLEISYRKLADLIPFARNSRTHSEAQIEQIAASIAEFGWTNPLLIDERGEIIAGHGRLQAAKLAGIDPVPCIELAGLSEAQRRALVIADNKLALNAGWDAQVLSLELADLRAGGFDISIIGFDDHELADLSPKEATKVAPADPDEIPEALKHPVSQPGDLWILGDHRLHCGDSTTIEAKDAVEAGECKLTLSDPPYGIGYSYADHDDGDNAANAQLVADAFSPGPEARVWTPGLPNLARDIERFGPAKVLVWSKRFAAAGNGLGGASTWEPVLVVGGPPNRKLANDVIEIMTDRETLDGESLRKFHSCPKPVALYELLLEAFSKKRQKIFEPFSGSGTTLIACERANRHCRAIEITPAYVDVAIMRWQAVTGREAQLASTGETFNALKASGRKAPPKPRRRAKG